MSRSGRFYDKRRSGKECTAATPQEEDIARCREMFQVDRCFGRDREMPAAIRPLASFDVAPLLAGEHSIALTCAPPRCLAD